MGKMGECLGHHTGRKLSSHQLDQNWHDKQSKKVHLGTDLKVSPFGVSPILLLGMVWGAAHQEWQNCARDGCLNFTEENDEVLVDGFGQKDRAAGDLPGACFK